MERARVFLQLILVGDDEPVVRMPRHHRAVDVVVAAPQPSADGDGGHFTDPAHFVEDRVVLIEQVDVHEERLDADRAVVPQHVRQHLHVAAHRRRHMDGHRQRYIISE